MIIICDDVYCIAFDSTNHSVFTDHGMFRTLTMYYVIFFNVIASFSLFLVSFHFGSPSAGADFQGPPSVIGLMPIVDLPWYDVVVYESMSL